jgi:predicted acylesterase/phospholipase RssA
VKYEHGPGFSAADPRAYEARVAVVLSAGGLRGAAHIGVLRQVIRHGVALDALLGVSAGAVVAAYYAAVGLSLDELISDAQWRLTDGGLSNPVPIAFAREVIGARHVIVSDRRWVGRTPAVDGNTVWIRRG